MAVLNRRDYYAAIPQLESKLSKLSKYITVEEGKLQIKIDNLYGDVSTLTVQADEIEGRVEDAEDNISTLTIRADNISAEVTEKAQVFTSQPTPPYYVGDLWTQGPSGEIYRCKTNRTSGNYTASDWELASDYTDDTTAEAEVANRTMLVRAYGGGTLTAYKKASGTNWGVLTNASGSVDIVQITWSDGSPYSMTTYASYDSSGLDLSNGKLGWYYNSVLSSYYFGIYATSTCGIYGTSNVYISSGSSSTTSISGKNISLLPGSGGTLACDIASNGSLSVRISTDTVISNNGTRLRFPVAKSDPIGTSGTTELRINTSGGGIGIAGSAKRLKEEISYDIDDAFSPQKLYDIDVAQFRYKKEYDPDNALQIGFIADDVYKHYPIGAVLDGEGNVLDWNYRTIIPPMLALIQEQNERIKDLERRLA